MNGHVHYGLTRLWALSEGFSEAEAETIANADIMTDRIHNGRPLDLRFHWGLFGAGVVAARRSREAAQSGDLQLLGEALHAAQDNIAHGFWGHFNHYQGIDIWERRSPEVRQRIEDESRRLLRRYRTQRGMELASHESAAPVAGRVRDRVKGASRAFSGRSSDSQLDLIATLNEVADAVSSAMGVDEVLDTIVERAKVITETDKAVLVLTAEHSPQLDLESIVVRGRRSQHDQEWWGGNLDALADSVFGTHEPIIEAFPEHHAFILASPLIVKDKAIGVICAINSSDRPFTHEEVDCAQILSAFAASAIENARLAEQSRYVLLASERDRIAKEMHDGVVQSLFSISLGLELCKKQVSREPVAVASRLDELQQHLNLAMTELRRNIYDLRPMKLTELGLVDAINYWIKEITQDRPVHGRLSVKGETPVLTPAQEACLYRVAKEAVSNIVRHSGASAFDVRIEDRGEIVRLTIEDDGDGFDVELVMDGGTPGLGLKSICDRVARDGGRLDVASHPGRGTVLTVEIPVGGTS